MMPVLTRRHRSFALALAVIAAGVFLVFVTRVMPLSGPRRPLRTCGTSLIFSDGDRLLSFGETKRRYHYAMEKLVEERMRLYEGRTLLQCSEEKMERVVPSGTFASAVAQSLPHVPDSPDFTYADFDLLLYEFWRTYDCHLTAVQKDPSAIIEFFDDRSAADPPAPLFSALQFLSGDVVALERERARQTFDRLMTVLRSSEQYLPLHASLRCLQRSATDVRNAFSLMADVSQCLPARLGEPSTSLIR